jgi:hypothetical protein
MAVGVLLQGGPEAVAALGPTTGADRRLLAMRIAGDVYRGYLGSLRAAWLQAGRPAGWGKEQLEGAADGADEKTR